MDDISDTGPQNHDPRRSLFKRIYSSLARHSSVLGASNSILEILGTITTVITAIYLVCTNYFHLNLPLWNITDTSAPISTVQTNKGPSTTEFTPHNPPQTSNFDFATICSSSKQWNDVKVCFPYCVANNPSEISCTIRIINIGDKRSLIFGNNNDTSVPFSDIVTDQGVSYESRNATVGGIKATYIHEAPHNSPYNITYLFEQTAVSDTRISIFEANMWFFGTALNTDESVPIRFDNIAIAR